MTKLGTIEITLKSPDGLYASLQEYMSQQVDRIKTETKPHEDWEDEYFALENEVKKRLEKFIQWSEYARIKINLDDLTATVVPT